MVLGSCNSRMMLEVQDLDCLWKTGAKRQRGPTPRTPAPTMAVTLWKHACTCWSGSVGATNEQPTSWHGVKSSRYLSVAGVYEKEILVEAYPGACAMLVGEGQVLLLVKPVVIYSQRRLVKASRQGGLLHLPSRCNCSCKSQEI